MTSCGNQKCLHRGGDISEFLRMSRSLSRKVVEDFGYERDGEDHV